MINNERVDDILAKLCRAIGHRSID